MNFARVSIFLYQTRSYLWACVVMSDIFDVSPKSGDVHSHFSLSHFFFWIDEMINFFRQNRLKLPHLYLTENLECLEITKRNSSDPSFWWFNPCFLKIYAQLEAESIPVSFLENWAQFFLFWSLFLCFCCSAKRATQILRLYFSLTNPT